MKMLPFHGSPQKKRSKASSIDEMEISPESTGFSRCLEFSDENGLETSISLSESTFCGEEEANGIPVIVAMSIDASPSTISEMSCESPEGQNRDKMDCEGTSTITEMDSSDFSSQSSGTITSQSSCMISAPSAFRSNAQSCASTEFPPEAFVSTRDEVALLLFATKTTNELVDMLFEGASRIDRLLNDLFDIW